MKKVYFVIIAFVLTCSISFGQMAGDIESIIPSSVHIFLKTKEISKLIKTMNYIVNNLMDGKQRGEFIAKRDEFKKNTGIDFLDEKSLKNAGVDTDRAASFASFDKDNTDDAYLLLIPVLNEEEAVLRFIEVVKKMNSDDLPSSNATAKYKNLTVYELKKNQYVTAAYKYLIIGSNSDIIKRAVDSKESRKDILILDENYKDYLTRIGGVYDINVFVTKRFIAGLSSAEQSFSDTVDYISAGFTLDKNKFHVNASVKLAKDNKDVKQYLDFLKTGVHAGSIYVPTADSTIFFSLDYKYINNFCKGEVEWCQQFNSLKEQMKNETGVDFEKDFLPYINGGMNIISQDSNSAIGGFGDVLVFIPMTDSAKIEELWNKMKKYFQTKYSKEKKFGEEKIGSNKGFWFIDESGMRLFVSYDKRGLYAGNSSVLMKSGLAGSTVTTVKSGKYKDMINDKTFFILNIKKNSFMKMLMQMSMQGNSDAAGWINRFGEMFLYCEKNDNFITINFEVEMKEANAKK